MTSLGVIGECMLEMRRNQNDFRMGYGGDVFNTAVYAVRGGLDVKFFTALGDDYYSEYLMNCWRDEGVLTSTVRIIPSLTPSLYIVTTDGEGERSFHYWRDSSPFKKWLIPGDYLENLVAELKDCECIYFSGITLGLLSPADRALLLNMVQECRAAGCLVAFDPNYRPRLWQSVADAKNWIDQAYSTSDIAFPSYDDEVLLRGGISQEGVLDHLVGLRVNEVVMKNGAEGTTIMTLGQKTHVSAEHVAKVVDTTAAGDSFNGGYLSTRLTGSDVQKAAEAGCKLAAEVIQHPGAISPVATEVI